MTELHITAGAERDFTESLQFYADRSKRAARGFEIEIARALDTVAANPDRYPLCDDRHRFVLYPFQVIARR